MTRAARSRKRLLTCTATAVLYLMTALPSIAAPPETTGVRWSSATDLEWDPTAGGLGYHVYQGIIADLPDDSTCLVGSNQSENLSSNQTVAVGEVLYYLVVAYDETGQSTVGAGRTTADLCKPARRTFVASRDGDQGDGVIDGDLPLRNPSVMTRRTKRETAGVILHSGEFFYSAVNLAIPGRHLDWAVERTYRSQVNYDGPLGHNWDFNFNARLVPFGIDVRYHDGSGRQDVFGRISATSFSSPAGRYDVLIENPDGSFALRTPHGVIRNFHAFDGSNLQGSLQGVEDRFGDRITLHYDHQGLMTTVTDGLGRAIDCTYDADGRLTAVTDFAGRSWVYGYDAAGDLISARSPLVTGTPTGNDFPAGKTTLYGYSGGFADVRLNHCMQTVINPNESGSGIPWIQNVYFDDTAPSFDQARIDTWTIGGTNAGGIPAGGTIDFSYESLSPGAVPDETTPRRRTTVIDRNGNQSRHVHNHAGNRIEQTLFTNREVRPGEPDYTTTYAYNPDGELTETIYPEGNRTLRTFDTPGLDRYREGNLLEVRHVADDLTAGGRGDGHGADVNDIKTTYEYEPLYNLVVRQTEPRGNDPSYVPQNGGLPSADRYSVDTTYCHQEGDPATNGAADYALRFGIDLAGFVSNLGDVNGDGDTSRLFGNPIRVELPEVALEASSNQAAIEGDTSQDAIVLHAYNAFGQRVATTDPEGNVHLFGYHPENDPDGDGTLTPTPPDGRVLDAADGGYPATRQLDTATGATRNNGTNPPPTAIETGYTYDSVGNLTHVVDGRGVLTRYVRNALNQVVEARRAAATADAAGPDGDPLTGRGESGLAALGFKVRYEYDANDNLTMIRREDRNQDHGAGSTADECLIWDLDDGSTGHEYEDETGSVLRTEFRYDPNRNLIQVIRPEGNTHEAAYDERDLMHTETRGATGPRGGAPSLRSFDYDGNGNLTRITDGRGHPVDNLYDGHDRPTRIVDQVGNTRDYFFDPAGQVVRTLDRGPVGGPTPADRSGTANVDLSDTLYLWDEQRRRIRTDRALFVPVGAAPGRPPVITEGPLVSGDGAVNTVYEYDRNGRLTFVTRDSGTTARTDYDGTGRIVRDTAPDGSTSEFTWDAQHNMVESAELELSSTPGPSPELFLTTLFHDALGRPVQIVDNLGQTHRYSYSSLDAVIKVTDPNGPAGPLVSRRSTAGGGLTVQTNLDGNVTDLQWDAAGRPLRVDRVLTASGLGDGTPSPPPASGDPNNPDGLITTFYGWDDNSLKTFVQDDRLDATTYSYDNLDRRTTRTMDDGTLSTYVYDPEHNIVLNTDANGSASTLTYDPANRATQLSVARAAGVEGTTLQTFEYDGLHRRTRATDDNDPLDTADDADVRRIYDSLSRVVEEKQNRGSGAVAEKLVDLRWNADALMTEVVYPSGGLIQYGYDAVDRLASVSDPVRSESAGWDWFGMLRGHTRSYGNGVRMTMLDDAGTADIGYDGVRRVTRMRHLNGADDVLAGFEHEYDRAGNRSHELRLHDEDPTAGGFRGELWSFDSANRLTDFEEGILDAALALVGPAADAQSWAMDGIGNWVQMTRNGTTMSFTPNNLHEYDEPQSGGTRTDDGQPDDAFDPTATPTLDGQNRAHDKNGNRTGDGSLQYVYDFRNRLVRLLNAGSGAPIAEYQYDALDRRVFREVTNSGTLNETRRYLYAPEVSGGRRPFDPGQVIEERDGADALVRQIVHGHRAPLWQILADGSSQYLHEDPRGSVVMLTEGTGLPTESAGDVLERYNYDPYGKVLFQDAANQDKTDGGGNFLARSDFGNTLLFGSLWYDPESGNRSRFLEADFGGLYLMGGGRYLEPDEGRHVTRSGAAGEEIHTDEYGRVKVRFSHANGNRYGFAGQAPVNRGGPMPQTREHVLLARQVGATRNKLFVGGLSWASGASPDSGGPMPQTREHILLARQVGATRNKLYVGGLSWSTAASSDDAGQFWFDNLRPGAVPEPRAKGPSSSEVKKYSSQTLKSGSEGPAAQQGQSDLAFIRGRAKRSGPLTHSSESAVRGYGDSRGGYFVADSFSFGVEREMKESGEKGGTQDINIGVGELQECSVSSAQGYAPVLGGSAASTAGGEFWFHDLVPGDYGGGGGGGGGGDCCNISCTCPPPPPPPPACCNISCSC